jgi:hypothetical protein
MIRRSLIKYPVIITPFLLMGFCDLALLGALYFAPRPPLSLVAAPLIRLFWGDEYLHYPANFIFLPHMYAYAKNALSFVTGLLFSAMTIAMIYQVINSAELSWRYGVSKALRKYLRMLLAWSVVMAVSAIIVRLLGSLEVFSSSPARLFILEFSASILTQTFFVYSIPSIIIENKKAINSIARSFELVKKYPVVSLAIILVPNLLLVPMNYADIKMEYIMVAVLPKTVFWTLMTRIIITTMIDFIVTSSAALLLLTHKKYENEAIIS